MNKKGKFIVIEGGEGSGKGTCMALLQKNFSHRDDVVFTREPGGTEFGESIRGIFLGKAMKGKVSVLSELFTFCALRANFCDLLVRPALKEGKNVITDRFDPSTKAYQIFGHEHQEFAEIFESMNSLSKGKGITSEIIPDLVIFLDVDPEEGLRRARGRDDENTRFDESDLEFHKRVQEGYIFQLKESDNWIRIDANQSEEVVKMEVLKIVKDLLGT